MSLMDKFISNVQETRIINIHRGVLQGCCFIPLRTDLWGERGLISHQGSYLCSTMGQATPKLVAKDGKKIIKNRFHIYVLEDPL